MYNFQFTKEQNQLYEEDIVVSDDYQRFQTRVILSADEVGIHRYQVRLSNVNGELKTRITILKMCLLKS